MTNPVKIDFHQDGPAIDATCRKCSGRIVAHEDAIEPLNRFLARHRHEGEA